MSDANPDNFWQPNAQVAQNDAPDPSEPPKVPDQKPGNSREVTRILTALGRHLGRFGGVLGNLISLGSWAYEYKEEISSYFDPPKSLTELQDAALGPSVKGYQDHHIVEQASARQDGFAEEMIDNGENVVRVPTLKHYKITGWYTRKSEEFSGMSPRDYLRGKSWDERMKIGREALIREGVMKP